MIGLDTNVVVRYLVQDDPAQSAKASALIESLTAEEPGYVTVVALVEIVWVLAGCYGARKDEVERVLGKLLTSREIVVEQADTVWNAVRAYARSKADFADCLIERSAHHAGCAYTATFDAIAAKTAGMRLIG